MIDFANDDLVVESFDAKYEYVPQTKNLIINKIVYEELTKIPILYKILTSRSTESSELLEEQISIDFIQSPVLKMGNGNLVEFKKEVLEFDMILPSGVGNDTPRKSPTEISYKSKKMKNKFT